MPLGLTSSRLRQKRLKIVILAAGFCLVAVFARIFGVNLCFFNAIFGIPCPACGMTRAHISLFRLDFAAAFSFHPLFFFSFIVAFMLAVGLFFDSLHTRLKRLFFWLSIAMIIALLLCYIVRMILYFPHTEPMDYNKSSLLNWLIRLFSKD